MVIIVDLIVDIGTLLSRAGDDLLTGSWLD